MFKRTQNQDRQRHRREEVSKITKENVIDECYTMICRIEAALCAFTTERVNVLVDNINDWHEVVEDFMYELKEFKEQDDEI